MNGLNGKSISWQEIAKIAISILLLLAGGLHAYAVTELNSLHNIDLQLANRINKLESEQAVTQTELRHIIQLLEELKKEIKEMGTSP